MTDKKPNRAQQQIKKRKSLLEKFNHMYPMYLVVGGVLVGILLSIFTVGGVALADLYGRVRSPEDIPQLNNPDWLDTDSSDPLWQPEEFDPETGWGNIDHASIPREELEDIFGEKIETGATEDKAAVSKAGKSYEEVAQAVPLQTMNGIENFLIIGTDTASFSGRSDVMIVASLNHNTRKLNLVSLYRAANVNIPGYGQNLLNAAYAFGGANLLIRTIES
ncbi:MAG: LCP family protein, partial [Eubacteriales bacterium]|nr:LCP family protein [Eubacteriales bacterium]